ncbi:MAG: DUF1989 domain-containing protein [Propionibacteriales bacterium]|nr:DUF1989 domain-containing protein [Propionibacteriales bacterium]
MNREDNLPDAMHKFAVSGRILQEWVIPGKEYAALTLRQGQYLRFVDIEGQQVPDLVCFDLRDLSDELNMANTLLLNRRRELIVGDTLFSVGCNPMMTIVDCSNSTSFSYGSMCSDELNRLRYGIAGTRNCRDNLAAALSPWHISARDIPNAFVPFMNVVVGDDGEMAIREPTSEAGDYYELRAEMDLLVAVSNCPQERNPCNAFHPSPMGIIVHE